jgi:hypothetical protein
MKQTAVEWLESEMLKPNLSMKDILEQAKEMEKQQIQDAYRINPNNEIWSNSGIDYYNETYNK